MMTLNRYKRALNRMLPVKDEKGMNTRFRATVKSGFKPYNTMILYTEHISEIKNNMFRVAYLEYVRYNIDRIAFHML